jgi:hypothetical protein
MSRIWLLAAIIVAAGCGGSGDVGSGTSRSLDPASTGDVSGSPIDLGALKPCTAAGVRSVVGRFLAAFNRGDLEGLDRIFAADTAFKWYSTNGPGARLNDEAYDRATLTNYFARRHERGAQLDLRFLKFNGNSDGYGHFEYGLLRNADDLKPSGYHGKGAAICSERGVLIAAWSMGRE